MFPILFSRLGPLIVLMAFVAHARGLSPIAVTADIEGDQIESNFATGDIVPLTLLIEGGDAGVLGVSLELRCASEAIRLRSVTLNPALSDTLGRAAEMVLPGCCYRTVRVQPPMQVDRAFAKGVAVWLARLEIEVLQSASFETALEVRAHGALSDAIKSATTVFGTLTPSERATVGRITIRNTAPSDAMAVAGLDGANAAVNNSQWKEDESTLTFEIQPAGGGTPVAQLAPHTSYELHYFAGTKQVNSALVCVAAPSIHGGLANAAAPPSGAWATPESFEYLPRASEMASMPWGPDGFLLTDVLSSFWQTVEGSAGPDGHLCDFTTGAAGPLHFDVIMDWIETTTNHTVSMQAAADYSVE